MHGEIHGARKHKAYSFRVSMFQRFSFLVPRYIKSVPGFLSRKPHTLRRKPFSIQTFKIKDKRKKIKRKFSQGAEASSIRKSPLGDLGANHGKHGEIHGARKHKAYSFRVSMFQRFSFLVPRGDLGFPFLVRLASPSSQMFK
jgi:hypothetical protein